VCHRCARRSSNLRQNDHTLIRQIAAIDSRRGIATDSGIPWKLPGDSAYFRAKTESGLIVMGRSTSDEFAAPLHDRDNYVFSRRSTRLRPGFLVVTDLDELRRAHPGEDIWIIGGATVYAETITQADELLLTQVQGDFHCTKFFPPYDDAFRLSSHGDDQRDGGVSYRFEIWSRIAPGRDSSDYSSNSVAAPVGDRAIRSSP
jgi:dihydrofolate reductase